MRNTFQKWTGDDLFFHRVCLLWSTPLRYRACSRVAAGRLVALTGGVSRVADAPVCWARRVLSAVVDNIPFVATMISLIKGMRAGPTAARAIEPGWWSCRSGACLGGNGTLTGPRRTSPLPVLPSAIAIRFGFVRYLVYGVPMTLVSIVICQSMCGCVIFDSRRLGSEAGRATSSASDSEDVSPRNLDAEQIHQPGHAVSFLAGDHEIGRLFARAYAAWAGCRRSRGLRAPPAGPGQKWRDIGA